MLGLAMLVKASDWFTGSAVRLGHAFGIPSFLIGVTIIALGTSLPELISSLVAVAQGAPEIVAGNVIGSNIANVLLVLGLAGVIMGRLRLAYNLLAVDLPFLMGSALFLGLIAWNGEISRGEAVLALGGFVIYIHYALTGKGQDQAPEEDPSPADGAPSSAPSVRAGAVLVGAGAVIYLGAHLTVQAVIALAALFGLGTGTIAASAVALGTSLPEVAVTLAALRRGRAELAVGNIFGSNIFNSFAVIGVSGLVQPLVVSPDLVGFALPMMLAASLLAIIAIMEQELTRWEGWLLLLFYVFFLGALFGIL